MFRVYVSEFRATVSVHDPNQCGFKSSRKFLVPKNILSSKEYIRNKNFNTQWIMDASCGSWSTPRSRRRQPLEPLLSEAGTTSKIDFSIRCILGDIRLLAGDTSTCSCLV